MISDDDDVVAPRRHRSPLVAVVAVLVVVALAVGGITIAIGRGDDDDDSSSSAGSTTSTSAAASTTTGPPATEAQIDSVVADISAFVAKARDLPFDHPVKVALLPDEAFGQRVAAEAVEDEKQLTETQDVLKALGLLEPGVSLRDTLTSFLEQGVVGFYDPKTDELVVRGAAMTPYVRITLAHELTHALDDQHFEIDRPDLDKADDERALAFSALVEGNALRIEDEYRSSLTKKERDQASAEEAKLGAGIDLAKIPRVVPELVGFPYIFGPGLVTAIAKAGGERAVDAAFGKPPVTSEQVVHPQDWLDGRATPLTVAPPKADGTVFDQGVLGFWGIYILVEQQVGQRDAAAAATGWGGDWYVAWKDADRTCVRASLEMDTPSELREVTSSLQDWAASQHDATVTTGRDAVGFTACS